MIEPPDALKKRGIHEVTFNLKPGQTVSLPQKLLVTLFGKELLRRFATTQKDNEHAD